MQTINARLRVFAIVDFRRETRWHPIRRLIGHVILPLVAGAAIYLSWRSPSLLMFQWAKQIGLLSPIMAWRHAVAPLEHSMPPWLMYSAPDALWVYSFTAVMILVWGQQRTTAASRLFVFTGALLGFGSEIGQAFGAIRGTYDHVDLVLSLAATFLARYLVSEQMIGRPNAATLS